MPDGTYLIENDKIILNNRNWNSHNSNKTVFKDDSCWWISFLFMGCYWLFRFYFFFCPKAFLFSFSVLYIMLSLLIVLRVSRRVTPLSLFAYRVLPYFKPPFWCFNFWHAQAESLIFVFYRLLFFLTFLSQRSMFRLLSDWIKKKSASARKKSYLRIESIFRAHIEYKFGRRFANSMKRAKRLFLLQII